MASLVPNERTLFHLVPKNDEAKLLLDYPKNTKHVSLSVEGDKGLEVGYHVSKKRGATVITRIGRAADLILPDALVSKCHLEFQLQPVTFTITTKILRTKLPDVVVVAFGSANSKELVLVKDSYVLTYGQSYGLYIRDYHFALVWRYGAALMKTKVKEEHKKAMDAASHLSLCDRDTVCDKMEAESYYLTRLRTNEASVVVEDPNSREMIGSGGYGAVWKTLDKANQHPVAVKVIPILENGREEASEQRKRIHREATILRGSQHHHIIELVHVSSLFDDEICMYMPLRDGSLRRLVKKGEPMDVNLKDQVLHQMLMALDFLALKGVCHRDLKPDNILFSALDESQKQHRFQLADFGMSRHHGTAVSQVGTLGFMAPEVVRGQQHGSRVDVWSLCMTLIWLKLGRAWPPKDCITSEDVIAEARTGKYYEEYEIMARENPIHRASAVQCLLLFFDGAGRSTMDIVNMVPLDRGRLQPAEDPPPQGAKRHVNLVPELALGHYGVSRVQKAMSDRQKLPRALHAPRTLAHHRIIKRRPRQDVKRPPQVEDDGDVVMGGVGDVPPATEVTRVSTGYNLRSRTSEL